MGYIDQVTLEKSMQIERIATYQQKWANFAGI